MTPEPPAASRAAAPVAARVGHLPPWAVLGPAAAALLLYLTGLCRHALPGDPSIYLIRADGLVLDGFAQTHPLYLVAAHLMLRLPGVGGVAAVSFFSALCGAVTVGLAVLLVNRLTGDWRVGVLAGVALAVAHSLWHYAVIPEVYTVNTLFMVGMILAAQRWLVRGGAAPLCIMGFLGGLGCANHLLAGMTLAICMVWAVTVTRAQRRPPAHLLGAAAAALLGLLPLVGLVVSDMQRIGIRQGLHMALIGGSGPGDRVISYGAYVFGGSGMSLARQMGISVAAIVYDLPSLALPAFVVGAWSVRRHAIGGLLLGLFAVHFAFAATYTIHEFWAFLLPATLAAILLAGSGFQRMVESPACAGRLRRGWLLAALALLTAAPPVALYWMAPRAVTAVMDAKGQARERNDDVRTGWHHYVHYLWPPKAGADEYERLARAKLAALPPGSALAMRPALRAVALYLQRVEGIRPDVVLVALGRDSVSGPLADGREVFISSQNDFNALPPLPDWRIEPSGPVWRLVVASP